jgi:isoquinoline 1-oxidoreductase beta subunit
VSADGQLSVPRVDIAFDCGAVINPDRVRSQLEGSVVQGISLATIGNITFKAGRVEQANFNDYEVLRIDATPPRIRLGRIDGDIAPLLVRGKFDLRIELLR